MLIRRERSDDIEAIDRVHRSAFATDDGAEPGEVGLVRLLRQDASWLPALSFVAEQAGTVVGHICLTRATVGFVPVVALGPIGVSSDHQGTGVGAALMHAAIGAADALEEPVIGLLGHLDYYPRFGFALGATLGIDPDQPDWAAHFQVRTLTAYSDERGEFRYAAPFYALPA
ncbi:GNAT family N-acetyltransferase [Antrihabitans cavernicola]|uniref:N-acetyltransferase n=1 Tax=Antrihabitans cavernicola TaxID=2495913 RepID=A0A5A7S829_9NOCA|nr:N-acetyltransferase [Spelaeibacter cavernicola]KAA0022318.1 N-acetyltransferase [Spelaeibacter cavernicola]